MDPYPSVVCEHMKAMGDSPFRNEQFENIARLKQRFPAGDESLWFRGKSAASKAVASQ